MLIAVLNFLAASASICSALFLWAVWNNDKSKQKDKALKNNTDRFYFEEI